MNEQATPLDIALAFTRAWASHDLDAASRYVANDIVFDGPLAQTTGAKPYLEGLTKLAGTVTDLEMIAAHGSDREALLMYDLHTGLYGTLTCAKCLTVRDGKIVHDKLTFDSYKIRQAQAAQPSH